MSLTPESLATATNCRSFMVSTCAGSQRRSHPGQQHTTISAMVKMVTSRLSSEPAMTTWISSTGIGVRIWPDGADQRIDLAAENRRR